MSNELKFIPTSMTDLENVSESVGDVIKDNVGAKLFISNLEDKKSLGYSLINAQSSERFKKLEGIEDE